MRKIVLLLLLVAVPSVVFAQAKKTGSEDRAKKIFEAWNTHDPAKMAALYTDDAVYEDVAYGDSAHGQAELKKFAAEFFEEVPDLKVEVVNTIVSNNRGSLEWILTGTDKGLYKTGKAFSVRGASLFELREGKMAHIKDFYDVATIMKQVGVLKDKN